jgi:hypothetical protein
MITMTCPARTRGAQDLWPRLRGFQATSSALAQWFHRRTNGDAFDSFGGAIGEDKARAFEMHGSTFMASPPTDMSV